MSARLLGGPFVTPFSLRRAARDLLLGDHLGIYLDEIVRQQTPAGPPPRIERPRDVVLREQPRRRVGEQTPLIVIACPGSVEVRYIAAEGAYLGAMRLEVHGVTEAADEETGGETASLLALGATALLLHELPRRTGFQTRWSGTVADDEALDGDVERTRHAEGHVLTVSGVLLSDWGGPLPPDLRDPPIDEPPADPGELPTVADIALTTTPVEEIDQ